MLVNFYGLSWWSLGLFLCEGYAVNKTALPTKSCKNHNVGENERLTNLRIHWRLTFGNKIHFCWLWLWVSFFFICITFTPVFFCQMFLIDFFISIKEANGLSSKRIPNVYLSKSSYSNKRTYSKFWFSKFEFSNFLLQIKNQRSESKTVSCFSII